MLAIVIWLILRCSFSNDYCCIATKDLSNTYTSNKHHLFLYKIGGYPSSKDTKTVNSFSLSHYKMPVYSKNHFLLSLQIISMLKIDRTSLSMFQVK